MKKLLGILVLGLLWCNVGVAEIVITTDGRTIELKEDGTYSILKKVDENEYTEVDMVDIYLDKAKWFGKKVKVKGAITNNMTKNFTIYQDGSMTGISFRIHNDGIPIDQVRFALKKCPVICRNAYILGKVVSGGITVIAVHSVIFKK